MKESVFFIWLLSLSIDYWLSCLLLHLDWNLCHWPLLVLRCLGNKTIDPPPGSPAFWLRSCNLSASIKVLSQFQARKRERKREGKRKGRKNLLVLLENLDECIFQLQATLFLTLYRLKNRKIAKRVDPENSWSQWNKRKIFLPTWDNECWLNL